MSKEIYTVADLTIDDLIEGAKFLRKKDDWHDTYRGAAKVQERWTLIREIYAEVMPDILAASQARQRGMISPYFVNWKFSPIEEQAWHIIRALGMPMYPQVPVDRFFVDFANPYYRIGIELDGAAYHDPRKDAQRDRLLAEQEWRIFRIPGKEFYTPYPSVQDWEATDVAEEQEQVIQQWMLCTAEGVMTAIDRIYFRRNPSQWLHLQLALRALDTHRRARFKLYPIGDWMRIKSQELLGGYEYFGEEGV